MLSIKEVCVKYGLSEVYVRRMILKGVIPTTKIEIARNTYKHMVDEKDLEAWRKHTAARSLRTDGRNKYAIYCSKEEFAKLQKLMEGSKLELPLQRANKVKKVK